MLLPLAQPAVPTSSSTMAVTSGEIRVSLAAGRSVGVHSVLAVVCGRELMSPGVLLKLAGLVSSRPHTMKPAYPRFSSSMTSSSSARCISALAGMLTLLKRKPTAALVIRPFTVLHWFELLQV